MTRTLAAHTVNAGVMKEIRNAALFVFVIGALASLAIGYFPSKAVERAYH
ncbi:hypothetical protein [Nocardia aurantia]|uniref:Uncharacterized protein n=1 Tax=Nocardia aurantia TaxID=2585199 RepID=A0A7K0DIN5_9NOCA|nr:hypothetical protein [Nocardia aurantia]MQY25451.1 hypothetical protein [Nocardia aurantia]